MRWGQRSYTEIELVGILALQLNSERFETALEAVAHHIGGTIDDAAEYIVKTQKETGANITNAVDTAGTSIAGAVKGNQQQLETWRDSIHHNWSSARPHSCRGVDFTWKNTTHNFSATGVKT